MLLKSEGVLERSRLVYFYFFFSGITALVYEIVWTRMLTLVFGHTVFSVSVVLAAFMAGLGLGSYLWGHFIDRAGGTDGGDGPPQTIIIYGVIEILIFISAAVLSLIFAKFHVFYSWLHEGLPQSVTLFNILKAVFAFILMVVPTTFMGATLPIISKYYVTNNSKLGSQIGILYAINTLGAAVGCILTGFIFISAFGVLQTALCASLVNLIIGIGCIRIYQEAGGKARSFKFPKLKWPPISINAEQKLWIGVSFLCGFTALAYEVLWTRLLVFSIASTVYSFSLMLAVFLLGIVLGSLVAIPLIARVPNLRSVLIIFQVGIGLYIFFTLFSMESLLSPPWNSYNLQDPLRAFTVYFKDSAALMLIPTLLFGASFPVLIKVVSGGYENVGRATGQIYASNTLGAIFGSLAAGFIFLPILKVETSLVLLATLNLFLALMLFSTGSYSTKALRKGLTVVFALVVLGLNISMPGNLLDSFYMRDTAGKRSLKKLLYFEEGLTDTVAVFKDEYGILDPEAKRLITNGISMSASNFTATRYMKLLAHLPILLSDDPENVLVICLGTGQTAGAAGIQPRVKSVDSIELSASVVRANKVFKKENHDVLNNPKVNIMLQDGRNHLLTTRKVYDIVTGEPPPPRTAFTVNLYTKDYYELIKERLKPGGLAAQWVPLHSQGRDEVDMHFKTFLTVFPYATAWLSVANEILLIGSDQPIEIDIRKLEKRLAEPEIKKVFADIGINNVYSLLSNIWFNSEQLEKLSAGQPVITDNKPYIEFYLEMGPVIGMFGLERLVFNRTPLEEIISGIKNMTPADSKILESHYKAMDLYQRGVMYGNRNLLLEAMELVPDSALFPYHLQAGRDQVKGLLEELESNPSNLNILLNLGHAFYQAGDYKKSAEFLKMVLEKEPQQSFANLYMGYNLMELGQGKEAKLYFEKAVKRDPRQLRTVMQEIALIGLLEQLEKEGSDVGLINAAAQFYNVKNKYRKSLEYSYQALEKDPMNQQAMRNAFFSYRGLGQPDDLIDMGERYEMIDPEDLPFQYIMAEIFIKTLRCDRAIPYLKKVLAKDDTYQDTQKLLNHCERKKTQDASNS